MPSFKELNSQIGQWNRLSAFDQNRDGQLSVGEIKQKRDPDQDGKLSEQELDAVGIELSEAHSELKLKYEDTQAEQENFQPNLFSLAFGSRVTALTAQRDAQVAEGIAASRFESKCLPSG